MELTLMNHIGIFIITYILCFIWFLYEIIVTGLFAKYDIWDVLISSFALSLFFFIILELIYLVITIFF